MDPKTIVIKKYENRRLYDTTNSRYVNLDEVAQAVRDGVDVQVVDATTGEDITRVVLTQIIVDNAKGPNSAFPVDVLRQMVMATGRASQESALKYMKAMFDMYANAYRAFSPPIAPFNFMRNPAGPGGMPPGAVSPPSTTATEGQVPASKSGNDTETSEARELRRRVEELEALVSKLGTEKAAPKTKKSGRK